VEADAAVGGGQGVSDKTLGRRVPPRAAGVGIESHDGVGPAVGGLPRATQVHHQGAVDADEFVGALGPVVGADRFARGGVQSHDGLGAADGQVHAVADGGQGLGGDTPLEPLLPQERAVERAARNDGPPLGNARLAGQSLVDDAEQPPLGRDNQADAGRKAVVAATVQRIALPLEAARRADAPVSGYGVVIRAVQVVRPFVDCLRPGLDGLLAADERHAKRRQNTHHVSHRHSAQVLGHHEVHEVSCVRQPLAREAIDRDRPVQPLGADVPAGVRDVGGVGVEAVHEIGVARAQGRRQSPVAATQVDHQPAFDARRRQDLAGQGLGAGGGRNGLGRRRDEHQQKRRCGAARAAKARGRRLGGCTGLSGNGHGTILHAGGQPVYAQPT